MTPQEVTIDRYRRHAPGYDRSAARTMGLRLRTIGLLQLQPGDVVLDVGAGTGLSFAPLLAAVGEAGRVLAFDQSPAMCERAEARVRREGWGDRVSIQCAAADAVRLPQMADAVLFNYVHDITRNRHAVAHLLSQVRPGAAVAVAGMKYFPWWTGPLNLIAWLKNRPYNAAPGDLWQPWDRIAPWCSDFRRWSTQWGMGYIACGRRRDDAPQAHGAALSAGLPAARIAAPIAAPPARGCRPLDGISPSDA